MHADTSPFFQKTTLVVQFLNNKYVNGEDLMPSNILQFYEVR